MPGPVDVSGAHLVPQSTFSELSQHLHLNNRVRVTVAGRQVEGKLVQLTEEGLSMTSGGTQSRFQCAQIERIEKRGDPIWNGALAGAAIIAVPAWNGCQNKGRNLSCVAIGMGMFAAIGGLLDKAHVSTRSVYVASQDSCVVRHSQPTY